MYDETSEKCKMIRTLDHVVKYLNEWDHNEREALELPNVPPYLCDILNISSYVNELIN